MQAALLQRYVVSGRRNGLRGARAGLRVKTIGRCGPGVEGSATISGLACLGAAVRCARLHFRTSRGRVGWVRLRRPTRCRRRLGRSRWPTLGGWWSWVVGGWVVGGWAWVVRRVVSLRVWPLSLALSPVGRGDGVLIDCSWRLGALAVQKVFLGDLGVLAVQNGFDAVNKKGGTRPPFSSIQTTIS